MGGWMGRCQQARAQHQAYGRASSCHQQGAAGGAALALHAGHSA